VVLGEKEAMSASEKLRKAMEDEGAWVAVGSLDPPPLHEAGTHPAEVVVSLRFALPQIVALVEEAERQVRESHEDDVDLELAAALTTLEEALS